MKKSVVILQDNIRRANALAEEFEKSGKFTVSGVSADGAVIGSLYVGIPREG